MIGISKLYCGAVESADVLRYNRESGKLPSELLQFSRDKKPVVVWNCTQTCNLRCVHCYAGSECKSYEGEMSSGEAKAMIDDLSAFGAPVLLFSGVHARGRGRAHAARERSRHARGPVDERHAHHA